MEVIVYVFAGAPVWLALALAVWCFSEHRRCRREFDPDRRAYTWGVVAGLMGAALMTPFTFGLTFGGPPTWWKWEFLVGFLLMAASGLILSCKENSRLRRRFLGIP